MILQKLSSKRGETLAEMLMSILLLGISAMILASTLLTCYRVNKQVKTADEKYYEQLRIAEGLSGGHSEPAIVRIESESDGTIYVDIDVDIVRSEDIDSLRAYVYRPSDD